MITKHKKGFTLIEVMIIMLMVAVAMAVTAPIMTQRKSDSDNTPWKFAKDRSGDAYFAEYDDDITKIPSRVYLGHKDTCTSGQLCGRLMIEKNTDLRYPIIFKPKNGNKYALFHDSDKFLLGQESWYSKLGSKDVFLVPELENNLSTGSLRTIVGYYGNSDRMNPDKISKCLWNKVGYPSTLGSGATGTGACSNVTNEATISTSSAYKTVYDKFISGAGDTASVTAGYGATAPSGYYATAVGNNASAAGYGSVAVGYGASAGYNYSVAIGYGANAAAEKATAIGYMAENRANGGVSIGPMAGYGANDKVLTAIGYKAGYNFQPSHNVKYGLQQTPLTWRWNKNITFDCIGSGACSNDFSVPEYFTWRGGSADQQNTKNFSNVDRPFVGHVTVLGDESTTVVIPGNLRYNSLYVFSNINQSGINKRNHNFDSVKAFPEHLISYDTYSLGLLKVFQSDRYNPAGSYKILFGNSNNRLQIFDDNNPFVLTSATSGYHGAVNNPGVDRYTYMGVSPILSMIVKTTPASRPSNSDIDRSGTHGVASNNANRQRFNIAFALQTSDNYTNLPFGLEGYEQYWGEGGYSVRVGCMAGTVSDLPFLNDQFDSNNYNIKRLTVFSYETHENGAWCASGGLFGNIWNCTVGWKLPFCEWSDKRLKNVSGLSTAGIDELNMLVPYNYTFKNDPKKTPQVGVIAQDLQNIFPDAVSEDENGFLTIRHEDMFYALVNAVKAFDVKLQELSFKSTLKRIVKLNKEIKELEDENTELKAKISDIYKRLEKAEKSL